MNKKDSISQIVNPVNRITVQDLPAKLVELSEEDLQRIVGGDGGEWTIGAGVSYSSSKGWSGNVSLSYKFSLF